ncbi:MAG: MOSC domain-containing protein [Sandaracinus sp.]|nr:MOSC domain-containing protein [Sandaracinus sp.]MCB9630666.1 MOSC domain-containing protein [Sandaracinus sp.]
MRVLSVNVADVRPIRVRDEDVATGIFKEPVEHAVRVTHDGLQGDAIVDTRKAGRENHAVYVYPSEHYAHWAERLGRAQAPWGFFGENLTTEGLDETAIRIGDVLRVGEAVLQVTSPRIPCRKLDARMGLRFGRVFTESRRVGFYLRVLTEGVVWPGAAITVESTDERSPTVDDFVRISEEDAWDPDAVREAMQARDLPAFWRETFEARLERALHGDGWHGFRPLRLVRRVAETEDVTSLHLACARGKKLAPFDAGQHLMLRLRHEGSSPSLRAYAISSSPRELETYRLTVRRVVGAGSLPPGFVSGHLHDELDESDVVFAAAPRGAFRLEPAPGHVFVAFGIGVAPVASMLHGWASDRAERSSAHVHLVRVEALVPELFALAERSGAELVLHEQSPDADSLRGGADARYYLAGPNPRVDAFREALLAAGVPTERVATERFGPRS